MKSYFYNLESIENEWGVRFLVVFSFFLFLCFSNNKHLFFLIRKHLFLKTEQCLSSYDHF